MGLADHLAQVERGRLQGWVDNPRKLWMQCRCCGQKGFRPMKNQTVVARRSIQGYFYPKADQEEHSRSFLTQS